MNKILLISTVLFLSCLMSVGQVFWVTNSDDGGEGSLRDAITQSNESPLMDSIKFNIPGEGPHIHDWPPFHYLQHLYQCNYL